MVSETSYFTDIPAEFTDLIFEGSVLLSINAIPVAPLTHDDTITRLSSSRWPVTLRLRRPLEPHEVLSLIEIATKVRGDPPKRGSAEYKASSHHQRAVQAEVSRAGPTALSTVDEEPADGSPAGRPPAGVAAGVAASVAEGADEGNGAVPRSLVEKESAQQRFTRHLEAYEEFCDDWGGSDAVKMQMFKRRLVRGSK